jgi:putative DNA primase/helicase
VEGAPLKSPFTPLTLLAGRPFPAKAGDSITWGSYLSAVNCVKRGLARGIGYEFEQRDAAPNPPSAGSAIYGIDLDHVIREDGTLKTEAREIVDKLSSYTEVSPSGTGLHIFVTAPGANITRHRIKDGFAEIYSEGRYFTVTGSIYGGVREINARADELQAIHDKYLLPKTERNEISFVPISAANIVEQDYFLRTGLKRDKVFASLWAGLRNYGNESSDDQALLNKLAYWCNSEPEAMARAFLQSPYYAQKDESHKLKCQRTDYLLNTARNACATLYSTAKADYDRWREKQLRERRNYAR